MKKGFTLVELLMVIAIIGLLTATMVFVFSYVKARSRDAVRVADVNQLTKALDLYLNETGSYPVLFQPVCVDGDDLVTEELANAGLITANISDPSFFDDTDKCYQYSSDGTTYSVRYYLETDGIDSEGFHIVSF